MGIDSRFGGPPCRDLDNTGTAGAHGSRDVAGTGIFAQDMVAQGTSLSRPAPHAQTIRPGTLCRPSCGSMDRTTTVPAPWSRCSTTACCTGTACSRESASTTGACRSEEHTSELQSRLHLVCLLLFE